MKKTPYNRTKIVATIGPATSSLKMLTSLAKAGVDVFRLNFSHGTHEDHAKVIQNIRKMNVSERSSVCILLDLQGPKLRVGEMENNGVLLKKGASLLLTTEKCLGTAEKIFVSYDRLPQDVKKGEKVLLDDGKIELKITEVVDEKHIRAKVVYGGKLSSKKGFNLPNTKLSTPSLTKKDLEDLEFGLEQGIEWVGLSFVRAADDIVMLRELIKKKKKNTRIVAKIEKPEAWKNIDKIIAVTDAVMVARGDLGVEMPMEQVPVIQKTIVKKCIEASKPVIIATQMMESMITSPSPTRAETNDVANAVMDGADAVMLSAETSVGAYPIQAVEAMGRIISNVEQLGNVYFKGVRPTADSPTFLSDEVCFTAVRMSDHLKATAIVGMTRSGYTAYKVSGFRPRASIFIFTNNHDLLNTLSLVWGVRGFYYDRFESTDKTFQDVQDLLKKEKLVKVGDIIIHTASMPIQEKSRTNTIKISSVS